MKTVNARSQRAPGGARPSRADTDDRADNSFLSVVLAIPAPPLTMEAYVTEKALGRGAMGAVFLVRRKADSLKLALKTVAITSARDRTLALNELAILRSLDHVHIVRFVDSFVHKEELCIAMELCAGGDLSSLLMKQRELQKRLPETEVRSMLAQLTSAMAHVHAMRIVHRDLKSSNIFLRQPLSRDCGSGGGGWGGGQHHLLIGDFGVAKALESTKAMACTQCGTPYYLPPEVCNGAQYDVKADIWSLGVLGYEICAVMRAIRTPLWPSARALHARPGRREQIWHTLHAARDASGRGARARHRAAAPP